MKKVKVMLTAAVVVAGLCGAFAFKAQKFGSTVYCTDTLVTPPAIQTCDELTNTTFTSNATGDQYCTTSSACDNLIRSTIKFKQ